MKLLLLSLSLLSFLSSATSSAAVFTGAAAFERLSHFKDVGVPAVVQAKDALNQAMIADGSCRATLGQHTFDGYAFFHNRDKVTAVIAAVAKLPSTRSPSRFVLTAQSQLLDVCTSASATANGTIAAYSCRQGFSFPGIASSMNNWHRALCASSDDPAWGGLFDPAYQPQQEALTIGFMCMLACDCNSLSLPAASLSAIAGSLTAPDESGATLCAAVPWGKVNFTRATDPDALAALAAPLTDSVCKCK